MKFCVRSRVSPRYLQQADEIRVDYRDRDTLYDLPKKYRNKVFILTFPIGYNDNIDWKELHNYNLVCEGNFVLNCSDVQVAKYAKENYNIKIMINTEATSYWELEGLINLGVEYAYVGIPLFFDLEHVKDLNIKLRTIPTVSYNHSLPHDNGICGQWIRPEDVDKYDPYIDVMEFEYCQVSREEALFRAYALNKSWNTRLDLLVEDLGSPAINRLINPELVNTRLNCRQRCKSGQSCHMCYTALQMANPDLYKNIIENK